MDRNRKILISILAMLVFTTIIAVVNISMNLKEQRGPAFTIKTPGFGPGIGIVRVEGLIAFSRHNSPLGIEKGSEAIISRLDELAGDSNIRAVVLRINSPGGTVAATQEIYQKLWKLRKANIPLVASMGEVAASGGYYIASACNEIVANQGTITGSIGVISSSPNLRGLYEKFGIKMNVIKSGRYKDIMSTHRDMSSDERRLIQELIDISYKKFLKDVALGRSMNQSDIKPYADGRVMSGQRALKYKLIDSLGTFEDAIDRARELAELPKGAPIYDEQKTPFEEILYSLDSALTRRGFVEEKIAPMHSYRLEYRMLP